jgi:hypothetical protein
MPGGFKIGMDSHSTGDAVVRSHRNDAIYHAIFAVVIVIGRPDGGRHAQTHDCSGPWRMG